MNEPIVSVLIAAYNHGKYIGYAIESVLASSFKDFELIIVDDRSKDNTVEIAQSYAAKDNRVKVYVNEKNLGDYPNRNKAASYARGKYLKYVDDDDYIYPWGLQRLVEMMEQFPECGWGLCSLDQYVEYPFPFKLTPEEAYLYNYKGPGLFHKAPLSSIIKREVFNAVGGFEPVPIVGDFDMWHRLAQQYQVLLMPQGIVWYREHADQESKRMSKFSKEYENVKIKYLNSPNVPLKKETVNEILKEEKATLIKQIIRNVITLRLARIKDNFTKIKQYYV